MIVKDYIKGRFAKFGLLSLDDADLLYISRKQDIDLEEVDTLYTIDALEIAIINFIPELLLCIDSVDEGGFKISKSNTKDCIMAYYNGKCVEYGIDNGLTALSGVTDASDRW